MVAVSPDFKAEVEELMVIVGATVSTVMEIVLEAVLLLPAAISEGAGSDIDGSGGGAVCSGGEGSGVRCARS